MKDPQKNGRALKIATVAILGIMFAYAIIRYHVIIGVSFEHFPLYISNKAIALSSIAFIALSYALSPLARFMPGIFGRTLSARKFFGLFGFGLGAIHAVMSLLLFSSANYAKFFLESGKLSLTGELSMLFGVLAFFVFGAVAYSSIPVVAERLQPQQWERIQHWGYVALVLTFFHVLSMGLSGWLKPEGWPGGLLPISMVAAIIIAFVLLLKLLSLLFPGNQEKN